MKRLLLLPLLISIFSIAYSQSVSVKSGCAVGVFKEGNRIHILANPCPDGTVFDSWTGNAPVEDPYSISTSFIMPSKKVNLVATYKPAKVWSPVVTNINGSVVYYYFPKGAIKGLITFYHGSGGTGSNWFLDEFSKLFVNYAVEEGYAVFATDSKDRVNKQWDMSGSSSVDVQNMTVMFTTLKNEGLITNKTPVFGVGMSDGSMFCSMIANIDHFTANALYCVPGNAGYIKTTTSPTQWCISQCDTTLMPNMMTQAQNNYQVLLDRGIDAQFCIHYATPVFPTLFSQQQSFDSTESKTVFNELNAGGVLNNRGFIVVNPMKQKLWSKYIDNSFSTKLNFIGGELTAAAAEHKFHNYFEHKTIVFFDKHLPANTDVFQTPVAPAKSACSIFPDPATTNFNIQSTAVITSISMFDLAGKCVKQFYPNSTTGQFPVGDLQNGVYLMRLTDENGKTTIQRMSVSH